VTVAVRPPLDETRRIIAPPSIELVSEAEMARAVLPIAEDMKKIVEPGASVGLAAALRAVEARDRRDVAGVAPRRDARSFAATAGCHLRNTPAKIAGGRTR